MSLTDPLTMEGSPERRTELRSAFSRFPSGVTAVCALGPDGPVGMAASSFTSVSMDPPLVSVCIDRGSGTWPRLKDSPRIGVTVLGSEHAELCSALASRLGDRFAGADWLATSDGAVFLRGGPLWLDCRVYDTLPAGDHEIVLLEVMGTRRHEEHGPLLFHLSRLGSLAG